MSLLESSSRWSPGPSQKALLRRRNLLIFGKVGEEKVWEEKVQRNKLQADVANCLGQQFCQLLLETSRSHHPDRVALQLVQALDALLVGLSPNLWGPRSHTPGIFPQWDEGLNLVGYFD
ncbi:hypothetical protein [Ralstonia pseudosolanacearum]|uniref:Uncharacterized protein n=1 Tax=Ralstonia solanacearum TaxID=305 RepID=A0A0S4WJ64_RALSL|nr:protein of unknown function [Ralstonia solanacearum]